MTTTLPNQWDEAHRRISIEPEGAIDAHREVRGVLEADEKLKSRDVVTILIGSYARKTAIFHCKDVDVFVKLPGAPQDATPEQVFTEVQQALVAYFGKERATEGRRSMRISGFEDELTVDAVPAVPECSHWRIPQTDRMLPRLRQAKDRWEETDPERLTELASQAQAASAMISGEPSYRKMVRVIKQMRDTHIGKDVAPGGLYFELLTYWAFRRGATAGSYAELLVPVLDDIVAQLASGQPVVEPAMARPYDPAPDSDAIADAAKAFARLAVDARRALAADDCEAASIWRRMLGENDRGPCFPLPPGCTEEGRRIAPLTNRDRGPSGDRPYA